MKFDDQFSVPQHTVCYCKWRRLPLVLAVSLATFILFWGVRSNIDALLSYVVLLKIVLPALLLVLTGRLAFALVHAALRSGSRFAAFGLFVATLAAALVIVNARARLPWLTDMLFTLSLLLYLLLIAVLVLTIMVAFRRSNTALDLVIYFTEFFAANVNLLISTIVNSNRHIFRLTGFYKFFVILSFSFVTIPQLVMSQEASPSSELIPFMCTDDRVLLSQGNPTGLFDISRESNPFTFVNVGENSGIVYNAMGFNPEDNFLYALRMVDVDKQGNLIRIDSNGTTIDLGAVANLPQRDYISADFGPVSNILYAADPFRLYLINVQTMEATLGPRFNIGATNFIAVNNADIAYNPIDQHFYTILLRLN